MRSGKVFPIHRRQSISRERFFCRLTNGLLSILTFREEADWKASVIDGILLILRSTTFHLSNKIKPHVKPFRRALQLSPAYKNMLI